MEKEFLAYGLDGHVLLGQPSKGHLVRIIFPQCSTTLLAPDIKKLETYFALFICLDFRTVCTITYVWVIQDESWQSVTYRAHNFDNLTWPSDFFDSIDYLGWVEKWIWLWIFVQVFPIIFKISKITACYGVSCITYYIINLLSLGSVPSGSWVPSSS